MLHVRPFHIDDFSLMPGADMEPGDYTWLYEHPSFTALDDHGRIVVIAGMVLDGSGGGEAWVVKGDFTRECSVSVVRTVRRYIRRIIKEKGLERVYAYILATDEHSCKWIEALGFHQPPAMTWWEDDLHYCYEYPIKDTRTWPQ